MADFLSGRVWLDDDGKHVWFAHICNGTPKQSMLPYGQSERRWHVAEDGCTVRPSIHCTTCGFHEIMTLGAKP